MIQTQPRVHSCESSGTGTVRRRRAGEKKSTSLVGIAAGAWVQSTAGNSLTWQFFVVEAAASLIAQFYGFLLIVQPISVAVRVSGIP